MDRIGISGWTYFDNDAKVKAPFDAQRLRERLEKGVAAN
jgi:uncharacterized protein YecE (DUF72 family)